MPEIIFRINEETGESEMEVEGAVGPACESVVSEIKQLMGQPAEEKLKPEYHVRTQVQQHVGRK